LIPKPYLNIYTTLALTTRPATTAAVTTRPATTAAATTSGRQTGTGTVGVYPGAQEAPLKSFAKSSFEQAFTSYKDLKYSFYITGDSADKVVDYYKNEMKAKGITSVTESNAGTTRSVTGSSFGAGGSVIVLMQIYDSSTAAALVDGNISGKTVFLLLQGRV
jgi:hypothetical protein